MNNGIGKTAAKVYGLTVVSSVISFIMYLSLMMIVSFTASEGERVSAGMLLIANGVALILQGILFVALTYRPLWAQGERDAKAVRNGRQKQDKLRGTKIGLLASVPSLVSYALLVAEKLTGFWAPYAAWYRVGQMSFYPITVWAFGSDLSTGTAQIGWGGIALAAISVLVLPVVCTVAYLVGYAGISLGERVVYGQQKP